MNKSNWSRFHLISILALVMMFIFEDITRSEMLLALIYLELTFNKHYDKN